MNLKKILDSSKGFTLIEILTSLTILGIILIGCMKFFTQAYSYTNMNQKKTAAINVARNAMMYIENESFIEIREKFKKNPEEELTLMICSNSEDKDEPNDPYGKFWKGETPGPSCSPITINNVKYDVKIQANSDKNDYDRNYILPITVKVEWAINGKVNETEIEGVMKSEDIR
ncbi:prepilin-type cleavage/methylation domain-containing protein [Bacillus methanolicus]|uniref:type IV pilus modification PilV family protein n=1 Tax=Bacillus methanolicus TaxID=1471 RepID=UPI002380234B|nr:type II secretion system protein [Bacillus methanolicus]MDE3839785.1 prepilin-type cleavage/methylation domain-containing protein [Bacillus methanolicus]